MDCNLFMYQNGPIGADLWQSEVVCPTSAHYPPSPYATTNKIMEDAVSHKPPIQWIPKPSIIFSLVSSRGLKPSYGLKHTNR